MGADGTPAFASCLLRQPCPLDLSFAGLNEPDLYPHHLYFFIY